MLHRSGIREICVFSAHSVIKHPPSSKLDLVSCRNLLIYLDTAMQDRVLRTFHYALKPDAHLFLGTSESVTRASILFGSADKKNRIFRRRAVDGATLPDLAAVDRRYRAPAAESQAAGTDERIDKSARRVMEKYNPPHVVVDRNHRIIRFSGGAMGPYLEPSPGAASFALFDILRKALRPAVRSVLQEVQSSAGPVRHENVALQINGKQHLVTLIAEPIDLQDAGDGAIVLAFQDGGPATPGVKSARANPDPSETVKTLEHDLRTTRSQLQSTIDELETANEEMKSSNEEYQSVNEELQSANEELETAKEEMQSVNEELQTVNSEVASKNDQLSHVNSDLRNLLESAEIATLFLDDQCRVRSFTRAVTEIFHVRASDIGRPIGEIVSLVDYPELHQDAKRVMRKLDTVEREVSLKTAVMTFILRIRPYRTIDNVIDGVVMTFVDITQRNAAEQVGRHLAAIVDSSDDAIISKDLEGNVTSWNRSAEQLFGYSAPEMIGQPLSRLCPAELSDEEDALLERLRAGETIGEYETARLRKDGRRVDISLTLSPIRNAAGEIIGGSKIARDIGERHRAEESQHLLLRELDHRVQNLFAIVNGVVALSARGADTPDAMATAIQGRLGALALAHALIRADKPGDGTVVKASTVGQLVATILAPFCPKAAVDPATCHLDGPEIAIGGDAVTSLALVLHELATNAAKYGALSVPDGQISIQWGLARGKLTLDWQERGGPPLTGAPGREGFGTLLARRSMNGQLAGSLDYDWAPDGLTVHLMAAAERLTAAKG